MTDQKCLVIGAAGGIGRSLIEILSVSGWSVVLAGRTQESLEEVAVEHGGEVVQLDARDFDAVHSALESYSGITAAVNLVGSILLKPAHLTTAEDFDDAIDLNLRTSFALVRAAGRFMKDSGGSVVLMSSCAATTGLSNHEAIASAKAGVEGLVRAAAATYASAGLRFNAVAPGLVDTPMSARITRSDASRKASEQMHPLGRIGRPDEIARVIAFLLDPANSWITGQVVGIDGGLSRVRTK